MAQITPNNTNVAQGNSNLQYITIKPGETRAIPKGAKIVSAVNYGNVNFASTCNTEIIVEDAQCYKMRWATAIYQGTQGDKVPLYKVKLDYIKILGVKYVLNIDPEDEFTSPGVVDTNTVENKMRSVIPQSLMKIESLTVPSNLSRRYAFTLKFQSVPSVADTIEMNIKATEGDGSFIESGLFIRPIKVVCGTDEPEQED